MKLWERMQAERDEALRERDEALADGHELRVQFDVKSKEWEAEKALLDTRVERLEGRIGEALDALRPDNSLAAGFGLRRPNPV